MFSSFVSFNGRFKLGLIFIHVIMLISQQISAFQDYVQSNSECIRNAALIKLPPLPPLTNLRVAIMIRGDSYRNWNAQHVNTSCCSTSRHAQKLTVESHLRFANHLLEVYDMETSFFIATYGCSNGKDYVERHLPSLFGTALKDMVVLNRSETAGQYKGGSQWDVEVGSAGRVVSLLRDYILRTGVNFDHIFSIRFDSFFSVQNYSQCAFPRQVFEVDRPVSTHEFIAHGRDEVLYLPARFLECWWYQLCNPVKYSRYQSIMFDVLLKLSGFERRTALPTHGLRSFSMYKLTPQTLALKSKDIDVVDCMCGKWLWTLDASNRHFMHIKDGLVKEYTARGAPSRNCSSFE